MGQGAGKGSAVSSLAAPCKRQGRRPSGTAVHPGGAEAGVRGAPQADPPPGQNALETVWQKAERLRGNAAPRNEARGRRTGAERGRGSCSLVGRTRRGPPLPEKPARAPGVLPSQLTVACSASPSRTSGHWSPGCSMSHLH